jgi:hypothetical protein
MKVLFKHLIQGYTGKADDLVIYYDRRLNRVIIRKNVPVKLTQRHENFGLVTQNLHRLNLSQGYKDDFRVYTDLYSRLRTNYDNPVSSWYNLFIRMMYGLAKADPEHVDLKTITRLQIETDNLPCISVKSAIQAGLLPTVRNYERLDNPI